MMQSVKTRQMDKMQKSSICLCIIVVSVLSSCSLYTIITNLHSTDYQLFAICLKGPDQRNNILRPT